jgi:hypothetical protein
MPRARLPRTSTASGGRDHAEGATAQDVDRLGGHDHAEGATAQDVDRLEGRDHAEGATAQDVDRLGGRDHAEGATAQDVDRLGGHDHAEGATAQDVDRLEGADLPRTSTASGGAIMPRARALPPTMETRASRPWKRASPDRGKPKILTLPTVHRTPERGNQRRKPHKII